MLQSFCLQIYYYQSKRYKWLITGVQNNRELSFLIQQLTKQLTNHVKRSSNFNLIVLYLIKSFSHFWEKMVHFIFYMKTNLSFSWRRLVFISILSSPLPHLERPFRFPHQGPTYLFCSIVASCPTHLTLHF